MFALLLEREKKKKTPFKTMTTIHQNIPACWQFQGREFWWKSPWCCCCHHPFLMDLQNCIYLFFLLLPLLLNVRLSAGLEFGLGLGLGLSTVAFSSSADQKRLLLASSLPLTYWYSVTFEFHNCSPTFIAANFGQGYHEALQRFLRRASVNESRRCLQQVVQRTAQTQ